MRLALILGAVVALAVLAGCGGSVSSGDTVATEDARSPRAGADLRAGTAVRDAAATRPVPLAGTVPRPSSAQPIPEAQPVAEPTPRMKGEAAPTSTPTPSDTTATPRSQPVTRALGIVEVDTGAPAGTAAGGIEGLTPASYGAGDEVPWSPGLYFLDVRTGEVEAWVPPPGDGDLAAAATDPPALRVSPGNRFVLWTDPAGRPVLHDRETSAAYTWDPDLTRFDRWLRSGDGERLLFQVAGTDTFELVDGSMQPVWRIEIPRGKRFSSPSGRYLLVQGCVGCEPGDRYHHLNIDDDPDPVVHTWTLPWRSAERDAPGEVTHQVELLDDLVTIVAGVGDGSCRAARYDLDGWLRSDEAVSCQRLWPGPPAGIGLDRIPPDEGLLSAATTGLLDDPGSNGSDVTFLTVYDAMTGHEIVCVASVDQGAADGEVLKLADSSALVLGGDAGLRFATINGAWRRAQVGPDGRGAPDDILVTNLRGDSAASLHFGAPQWAVAMPDGAAAFMDAFADWGVSYDTLRVRTTISRQQAGPPGP